MRIRFSTINVLFFDLDEMKTCGLLLGSESVGLKHKQPYQPLVSLLSMNNQFGEDQDETTVMGFEVPRSPDSSYNNVYPGNEDDARDPPVTPPHLHRTLLSYPASMSASGNLPLPENVILNHLYIENREAPRSVVALGFTHRFRSKYVTVVLYKPVPRRGSTST